MPNVRRNLAATFVAGGTDPLKMRVITTALKIGTNGTIKLQGQGGVGPYAFSMISGAMPTVCTFTASITTNVMTVTAVANGTLKVGQVVAGAGITYGTTIVSLGTGAGGTGTYNLSVTPNVASEAMTTSVPMASTGYCSMVSTTGLPSVAGTFSFVAQVQDSATTVYTANFTVVVNHVLTGVAVTPTPAESHKGYSYQFSVSGATGTVTWSLSGSLPPAYTFTSGGLLSGSTVAAGGTPQAFPLVVTASDSGTGDSVSFNTNLNLWTQITTAGLAGAPKYVRGTNYTRISIGAAAGGVAPYTYSVDTTNIPWATQVQGLSAGVSGTPTTAGTFSVPFTATDSAGYTSSTTINLIVIDPSPVLQPQQNAANVGAAGASNVNVSGALNMANDGTTATINAPLGPLYVGDGSDGAMVADGTNTYPFATLASGTYLLNRDVYLSSFSISATKHLVAQGFNIYCNGSFDLSNASADAISPISVALSPANGGAGAANGGAVGAGGTPGVAAPSNYGGDSPGTAGGLGNVGAGSNGTAGTTLALACNNGTQSGGAGGLGSGGAGGPSGSPGAITRTTSPRVFSPTTPLGYGMGGTGGGGGGGDATNKGGSGGGGGCGGGFLFLSVATLITNGSTAAGAISAKGFNGGVGGAGTIGNTGGAGGGAGGAGGCVFLAYGARTGTAVTNLVDASGGNGGNGGAKIGTGVVGNGGSQGKGGQITVFNLTSGAITTVNYGAAGTNAAGQTGGTGGASQLTL
jgi:hypothetical protein